MGGNFFIVKENLCSKFRRKRFRTPAAVKAAPRTVIERIALKMDRKHTVMVAGITESKEGNSRVSGRY